MLLTNISIKNAPVKDKQYKLPDGEGMYLLVHPNGGKYWRLRYKIAGKEKVLALGTYPDVTLLEARDKKHAAKEPVANPLKTHLQISLIFPNYFLVIKGYWS